MQVRHACHTRCDRSPIMGLGWGNLLVCCLEAVPSPSSRFLCESARGCQMVMEWGQGEASEGF